MNAASQETIGDRIAREFSTDKVHLTSAEQRRLSSLIDKQLSAFLELLELGRAVREDVLSHMVDGWPGTLGITAKRVNDLDDLLAAAIAKAEGNQP